jgi:sulfur relay (sulfurtransferase) complex TusBCD TusD component (DsrE family)
MKIWFAFEKPAKIPGKNLTSSMRGTSHTQMEVSRCAAARGARGRCSTLYQL